MQKNFMDGREKDGGLHEQARINVVIAYDTAEMGRRAMRALRSAIDGAPETRPAVDLRLWRLDLLADVELRELANAELRKADILLFAIESADSLPPVVDNWFQDMGDKGAGARGLALLFDKVEQEHGSSRLVLDELRSRAEARRIDFLTNISDLLPASRPRIAAPGDNFAHRSTPVFDAFERSEDSRGCLND